ncbi:MAG TPA: ATP-binding protein [Candidatus Omnitrophota bacterium]|nr:ATP-binding protein [Candidatus Omnitrophota bacterium]HPT39607.1 ATP-binding protein [Candidatus Omnitrophota bacterium]
MIKYKQACEYQQQDNNQRTIIIRMSFLTIIYIVTPIASIVIALLLIHWARLSEEARIKDQVVRKKEGSVDPGLTSDEPIKHTVYKELSSVLDSKEHAQEATKIVAEIFSQELNKRVEQTTKEISRKYESIIEANSKNEEIVWNKYNRALSEKKQTDAVIRSVAEGLLVVDAKGKVIMMNPAAERLLGVSRKDKIGKSINDSLKEEQLVSLVKDSKSNDGKEIELSSQNNETSKTIRASSAVIENENGQTVGMVSVLSDITKQKEIDRLKSSFVANVTHELRTPLVSIDKAITLLLSKNAGGLSESQEQFLSIASRNCKRLGLLINDLLDLAKLEAGKMDIRLAPSFINQAINDSVEGLVAWASAKSISLVKQIPENLPAVKIDADKIVQVLNNLIGNAIKFTPANGTITVSVQLYGDHEVMVSVQDTGVGIAKNELDKVFDKFYQTGERVATDVSGTGIGLSIAKEIVQAHGGKIWAESDSGQGTKFSFTVSLN